MTFHFHCILNRNSCKPPVASELGQLCLHMSPKQVPGLNPIALRTAKTLWSFGHSECNKVKRVKSRLCWNGFVAGGIQQEVKKAIFL